MSAVVIWDQFAAALEQSHIMAPRRIAWASCGRNICAPDNIAYLSLDGVLQKVDEDIGNTLWLVDCCNGWERPLAALQYQEEARMQEDTRNRLAAMAGQLTESDRHRLLVAFDRRDAFNRRDYKGFARRVGVTAYRLGLGTA